VHKAFFREYTGIDLSELQHSLGELEKFLIVEYDNIYRRKLGLSRLVFESNKKFQLRGDEDEWEEEEVLEEDSAQKQKMKV